MSKGPSEHQDTDDLAAYLLGALPDDDARDVRSHLDECPRCLAELARLSPGVHVLKFDVPQIDPPSELKSRLMAEVDAQAELFGAAARAADRPARRSRWRPLIVFPVAAAMVVAALVVSLVLPGGTGTHQRVIAANVVQAVAPGARASLLISDRASWLKVRNMPPPPAGRVYEVWLQRAGARQPEPTSALFDVPRDGTASIAIPDDLRDVRQVLVTIEPSGGSLQPTTPPVISARLS
jgi:anti-sigma-K factor RskA